MAKPPEASVGVLTLPDQRIVIQRKDEGAPTSPNMLALFGGAIEKGETPEEAMVREIDEETSLDAGNLKIWRLLTHESVIPADAHRPRVIFHVFRVLVPDVNFEVFEGAGKEVYSLAELLKREDVAPSTMNTLIRLENG